MDEGIKAIYKMVHGLDVDKCKELSQPFQSLEIRMSSTRINFLDFLKGNSSMISMDYISTKKLAEEFYEEHPEFGPEVKNHYIEVIRQWGLIKYSPIINPEIKPSAVGFVNSVVVHNGFSKIVSSEKCAETPENIQDLLLDGLRGSSGSYKDLFAKPQTYMNSKIFLLNDFYEKFVCKKGDK